jgi:hypothetical protein
MSQADVEIVLQLVRAFYGRDVETITSTLDAEIEFPKMFRRSRPRLHTGH